MNLVGLEEVGVVQYCYEIGQRPQTKTQKQRKIWLKLVSDGKTDGRRDKAETVYHFLLQSWGISSIEVIILSNDELYLPVNSQGGCIIAQKLRRVEFDKIRNVETNIPDVDVWNKL